MAKFFKNYNQITYKILEEVTNNISQDELEDIEIDPKYLGMTPMKHCDFCDNIKKENTRVDEITIMFGYQVCEDCERKKIGSAFKKKWCIKNKIITTEYFIKNLKDNHLFKKDIPFCIQRTDGSFEEGWRLDTYDLVKYVITDEETEDLLLPFYKSSIRTRTLHKFINLSELCRFNKEISESYIIDKFKSIIENYKN